LGTIVLVIIAFVVMFAFGMDLEMFAGGGQEVTPEQLQSMGIGLVLGVLVALALAVPFAMAFWFAPALVVIHDLGAIEALKLSFLGCLRNIIPFLLYGIIAFVLFMVATLPLMLGWLVMIPVLFGSTYAGYKDIFVEQE
jgi:uncharacterized membrane protein